MWEIQNSIFTTLFLFLRFDNFRFSVLSIMTIYLSELKLVNSRLDLGNMMKVILTLKYTVVQLQNFGIRMWVKYLSSFSTPFCNNFSWNILSKKIFQYEITKLDVEREEKVYPKYGSYPRLAVDLEFKRKAMYHNGELKTE